MGKPNINGPQAHPGPSAVSLGNVRPATINNFLEVPPATRQKSISADIEDQFAELQSALGSSPTAPNTSSASMAANEVATR